MELHDYIATKIGIIEKNQIDCIQNIVENTVLLNEYKTGQLTETKLDVLVKAIGSFLQEILKIMNNPDKYVEDLENLVKDYNSFHNMNLSV